MLLMAEHIDAEALHAWRESRRLTQEEVASKVGVSRSTYANWERQGGHVPRKYFSVVRGLMRDTGRDVGSPAIPVVNMEIPIPFIGLVNANMKTDWDTPNDTDALEFVPGKMGDAKGRFAARVESDCMYPFLHPDDLIVLQQDHIPKLGRVVLFRLNSGEITLKQLKHDGSHFVLHALNPLIEDTIAEGSVVGYVVGIVRRVGQREWTDYDPSGLIP